MATRETPEFYEQATSQRYPNRTYEDAPETAVRGRSTYYRSTNIIYVLFGLLEISLVLRFLFLLLGANRGNGFVTFIYTLTGIFVAPFYGIFSPVVYNRSFFDPATLIAILVYAFIAWALVRIVAAASKQPVDPT